MGSWLNFKTSGKAVGEEKHEELVKQMNNLLARKHIISLNNMGNFNSDYMLYALETTQADAVTVYLNQMDCLLTVTKDMLVRVTNKEGRSTGEIYKGSSDKEGCSYISEDGKMKQIDTPLIYKFKNKRSINHTGNQQIKDVIDFYLQFR